MTESTLQEDVLDFFGAFINFFVPDTEQFSDTQRAPDIQPAPDMHNATDMQQVDYTPGVAEKGDENLATLARRFRGLSDAMEQRRQAGAARYSKLVIEKNHGSPVEQFANSISTVAGLLVVATLSVMTADPSKLALHHPHVFHPETVRTFAALCIGLFLVVIIVSQGAKLASQVNHLYQIEERILWNFSNPITSEKARDRHRKLWWRIKIILLLLLVEILGTAILFFLLIVVAYVGRVGSVFIAIDAVFLAAPLGLLVLVVSTDIEFSKGKADNKPLRKPTVETA